METNPGLRTRRMENEQRPPATSRTQRRPNNTDQVATRFASTWMNRGPQSLVFGTRFSILQIMSHTFALGGEARWGGGGVSNHSRGLSEAQVSAQVQRHLPRSVTSHPGFCFFLGGGTSVLGKDTLDPKEGHSPQPVDGALPRRQTSKTRGGGGALCAERGWREEEGCPPSPTDPNNGGGIVKPAADTWAWVVHLGLKPPCRERHCTRVSSSTRANTRERGRAGGGLPRPQARHGRARPAPAPIAATRTWGCARAGRGQGGGQARSAPQPPRAPAGAPRAPLPSIPGRQPRHPPLRARRGGGGGGRIPRGRAR